MTRLNATNRLNKQARVVEEYENLLYAEGRWSGRWTSESREWKDAEILLARRTYRRALDDLERAIVMRLMEMMKANQMETGKHPHLNADT